MMPNAKRQIMYPGIQGYVSEDSEDGAEAADRGESARSGRQKKQIGP